MKKTSQVNTKLIIDKLNHSKTMLKNTSVFKSIIKHIVFDFAV